MKGFKKGAQCGAGLKEAGEKMGYKYGGQVKTSSQDSMDDGVQPARQGRNQQEVEAGGTKRMTPGYAEGGQVMSRKQYASKHGTSKGYREYMRETTGAQATETERQRMKEGMDKVLSGEPEMKKAKGGEADEDSWLERLGIKKSKGKVKNPYPKGSKRADQWEAKHGKGSTRKAKAYAVPGGALAKRWGTKSQRAMDELGLRTGGPVAAKKGGLSRAVHNSKPMYGKK